MKRIYRTLFLILIIFSPFISRADVSISEIMYDPPGSDTGREWIEIYNDGGFSVNLSSWKFFEEGTNHSLSAYQGGLILNSDSYAVIVSDPSKFLIDYPEFSGMIIKSSWSSFNNSGESLALKDNSNSIVFEVTYIGGTRANGDGYSLQYYNGEWIAAVPTPGMLNTNETNSSEYQNTGSGGSSSSSSFEEAEKFKEPEASYKYKELTILMTRDNKAVVGVPYKLKLKIFDKKDVEIRVGRFVWNFGDGTKIDVENKLEIEHTYKYPGKYVVFLDYSKRPFAYDEDASLRFVIDVIEPGLKIESVDIYGGIKIRNDSDIEKDISGWVISANNQNFILPPRTFILAKGNLQINPNSHGIFGLNQNSKIELFLPNGQLSFSYQALSENIKNTQSKQAVYSTNSVDISNTNHGTSLVDDSVNLHTNDLTASVVLSQEDDSKGLDPKIFIGSFILFCLVILFVFYRWNRKKTKEDNEADEYKILS